MKGPSLPALQAKADKIMSIYIRMKYADADGLVKCVSCGRTFHWKDVDCGHFVPKSRGAAIRYVEENVHPECRGCNSFNDGHLIGYTLYMIDMYGREKIDELKREARKVMKPSEKRAVVEEAIAYYTQALKALA
jgi:5-methylcytosine-specific restriction endonuclease McrA